MKRGGDGHSIEENREAKIRGTFFQNDLFIIYFHWSNLYFSRISIRVYKNNHRKKDRDDSDKNNPGIYRSNTDGTYNSGTNK